MSFGHDDWEADPPLTRDMRTIFNDIMNRPVPPSIKNNNIFGKDLIFDENANKITLWMSMHIIKSFGSEDWDADPPLTRDMREIFNDIMNMEIPPHEREYFDPNNLKFDPNCNEI